MRFLKLSPLIWALLWCSAECQPSNILTRPLETAGQAINELANVSLGAVKTALDVVETGIDTAIETRNIVTDRIRKAFEDFRKMMGSGFPELGIPALDPLVVSNFNFNIDHQIGKFNGSASDVVVEDLALFVVNKIDFRLPVIVKLNITFPRVRVKGFYDVNGEIGDMFNLFGNGPFNFTMYDLSTSINTSLKYTAQAGRFEMKDLSLDVKLGGMEANFENLMGGGETGAVFNKVIGELAPEAVDILWPELKSTVTERLKHVADDILKKIDLSSIFG